MNNSKTQQFREAFSYRLRRKMLTPKMRRVLRALDTWVENNPDLATCQQIANLAGVSQTYVQLISPCLEAEGYVKLWRNRRGALLVPGIFIVKGLKSIEVNHEKT